MAQRRRRSSLRNQALSLAIAIGIVAVAVVAAAAAPRPAAVALPPPPLVAIRSRGPTAPRSAGDASDPNDVGIRDAAGHEDEFHHLPVTQNLAKRSIADNSNFLQDNAAANSSNGGSNVPSVHRLERRNKRRFTTPSVDTSSAPTPTFTASDGNGSEGSGSGGGSGSDSGRNPTETSTGADPNSTSAPGPLPGNGGGSGSGSPSGGGSGGGSGSPSSGGGTDSGSSSDGGGSGSGSPSVPASPSPTLPDPTNTVLSPTATSTGNGSVVVVNDPSSPDINTRLYLAIFIPLGVVLLSALAVLAYTRIVRRSADAAAAAAASGGVGGSGTSGGAGAELAAITAASTAAGVRGPSSPTFSERTIIFPMTAAGPDAYMMSDNASALYYTDAANTDNLTPSEMSSPVIHANIAGDAAVFAAAGAAAIAASRTETNPTNSGVHDRPSVAQGRADEPMASISIPNSPIGDPHAALGSSMPGAVELSTSRDAAIFVGNNGNAAVTAAASTASASTPPPATSTVGAIMSAAGAAVGAVVGAAVAGAAAMASMNDDTSDSENSLSQSSTGSHTSTEENSPYSDAQTPDSDKQDTNVIDVDSADGQNSMSDFSTPSADLVNVQSPDDDMEKSVTDIGQQSSQFMDSSSASLVHEATAGALFATAAAAAATTTTTVDASPSVETIVSNPFASNANTAVSTQSSIGAPVALNGSHEGDRSSGDDEDIDYVDSDDSGDYDDDEEDDNGEEGDDNGDSNSSSPRGLDDNPTQYAPLVDTAISRVAVVDTPEIAAAAESTTRADVPMIPTTNLESLSSAESVASSMPTSAMSSEEEALSTSTTTTSNQHVSHGDTAPVTQATLSIITLPNASSSRDSSPIGSTGSNVVLSGGGVRVPTVRRESSPWAKTPSSSSPHLSTSPDDCGASYDDLDDLSSYHPPAPTSHVAVVMYAPRNPDEMLIQAGDLIGIEKAYKDGWARGQNISQSRRRCIFPMAIVTPIVSGPTQTVRSRLRGNMWTGSSATGSPTSPEEVSPQILQAEQREAALGALGRITPRDDSLRRLRRLAQRQNPQQQMQGADVPIPGLMSPPQARGGSGPTSASPSSKLAQPDLGKTVATLHPLIDADLIAAANVPLDQHSLNSVSSDDISGVGAK